MSDMQLSILLRAVDRMTGPLRKITRAFRPYEAASRRAAAATRVLDKRFEKMQRTLQMAGNLTLATGGLAMAGKRVTGAFGSIIGASAQFDESMSKVRAVTQAGDRDFQAMTKTARALGSSTSFTAQEVADGMGFLGRAGFKTQKIIGAMPATLSLAKAGGIGLAEAADIASNALSAFGLEASEMNRVADVLALTTSTSNTNMTQLAEAFNFAAPGAAAAGMGIDELTAFIGVLGDVGIQGSNAGTVMRSLPQRLAAPVGAAGDLLEELGIQTRTLEGDLRSPIDIMEELAHALNGVGGAEVLEGVQDIFGRIGSSGAAAILDAARAGKLRDALEARADINGWAKKVAETMTDNLSGDWVEQTSAWSDVMITMGKALTPLLRDMVQWLTKTTQALGVWMKEYPTIVKWVGIFVGALGVLMLSVGSLGVALAGIIGTMAAVKFGFAVVGLKVIPSLVGALFGLKVAFFGIPIIGWIAALVTAAALVYENWDTVKEFFIGLWDGVKVAFFGIPIIGWIAALVTAAALVYENWDTVKEFFIGLWDGVKEAWNAFGDWIYGWFQQKIAPYVKVLKMVGIMDDETGSSEEPQDASMHDRRGGRARAVSTLRPALRAAGAHGNKNVSVANGPVTIHVNGANRSPEEIARAVAREQERVQRGSYDDLPTVF